ncbi:replication initiator [Streptomyces sp. MUSC 14]|uniref:replication initiator n=1 Tax=Streptomyces sp. MUSC 14 TaxID=1354889 RepID=UPI0035294BC8
MRDDARVSFAEVAEYQKRGAVHFHAVIRIDGPGGGDTPPPAWVTAELLTGAITAAAAKVRVDGPTHVFTFGRQLDVRTIRSADFNDGQELTWRAAVAYIASTLPRAPGQPRELSTARLKLAAALARLDISDHTRRPVRTAWTLGARERKSRANGEVTLYQGGYFTPSTPAQPPGPCPARSRSAPHVTLEERHRGRCRRLHRHQTRRTSSTPE